MKTLLLITLTAFGLAQTAFAANMMDADGDGNVTFEEAQASHPDLTQDAFNEMDANQDGVLDQDEITAAVSAGQLPDQG